MMKDFKIIEAAGTPYEIGFAHGEQGREEVLCSIATYKEMFKTYANLGWEEAKHRSRAYIEHISRYDSDLLEEIRGVAAGAGVELEDILALNARSEVILMSGSKMPSDGCTAVAVTPESTQDRHTILAQNWDWKGRQIEAVLVLKIIQQDKPAITMVTEGGIIGKVGFNDAGIGVCLNALGTVGNPYGLPLHIVLRGILDSRKLSDAIQKINAQPNACAANYLLAAKCGEALAWHAGTYKSFFVRQNETCRYQQIYGTRYVFALWSCKKNAGRQKRRGYSRQCKRNFGSA